jgi:hypothetical protein
MNLNVFAKGLFLPGGVLLVTGLCPGYSSSRVFSCQPLVSLPWQPASGDEKTRKSPFRYWLVNWRNILLKGSLPQPDEYEPA